MVGEELAYPTARDAFPTYKSLRAANSTATMTHVAAPGSGKRIIVFAAMFSRGLVSGCELRSGATGLMSIYFNNSSGSQVEFTYNPYGWFRLADNAAFTSNVTISSIVTYKIVPV